MNQNDVLELAQRSSLSGRPNEDRITIPVSLYRRALRLAVAGCFSEDWYLTAYPDVKEAVAKGIVASGLDHYIDSGIYEGRFPFELLIDEDAYYAAHPDVEEAVLEGDFTSALNHFKTVGYAEGRRFSLRSPDDQPRKTGRK